MKGDRLDVITLVNVGFCGLGVPDGAKGALVAGNVAAYKRLEKPCAKARRVYSEEDYSAPKPQTLVQISHITSRGFDTAKAQHTRVNHRGTPSAQEQLDVTSTAQGTSSQDVSTDKTQVRQTQTTVPADEAFSVRSTSTITTSDLSAGPEHHIVHKRRAGVWDIIPKTHEDVILTKPIGEINYMDPLGPENGYADWQHR